MVDRHARLLGVRVDGGQDRVCGTPSWQARTNLFVTQATVKTHLSNVQRKPAVRNRVEIAAWAWERRLIS